MKARFLNSIMLSITSFVVLISCSKKVDKSQSSIVGDLIELNEDARGTKDTTIAAIESKFETDFFRITTLNKYYSIDSDKIDFRNFTYPDCVLKNGKFGFKTLTDTIMGFDTWEFVREFHFDKNLIAVDVEHNTGGGSSYETHSVYLFQTYADSAVLLSYLHYEGFDAATITADTLEAIAFLGTGLDSNNYSVNRYIKSWFTVSVSGFKKLGKEEYFARH